MDLGHHVIRKAHASVFFLPQMHNLKLTMRKTPNKYKLKNTLQNTSPEVLKTVKIIQNKEILRNYHSLVEANET